MTPALLMVLVRAGFRLGQDFLAARDLSARTQAAESYIALWRVPNVPDDQAALGWIGQRRPLAERFPNVFNLEITPCPLLRDDLIDQEQMAEAIALGADLRKPQGPMPDWAGGSVAPIMAVQGLLSPEARRGRWARFGLILVQTGIEAVAAQPDIVGLGPKAETLIGAFASRVQQIIGPDGIRAGEVEGVSFKERAAAVLLQASLQTISENPTMVVSAPHWAQFVGAVLSPLAAAQAEEGRHLISLSRLPRLMRGPVAQAALRTLHERQGDFFGSRFAPDTAAGAITESILASAVRTPSEEFDILDTFSQRGLTRVYTAALDVAATRPELFIDAEGRSADSLRALLGNVAGVLRDAPPPFDAHSGLGDRLTCAVIDVAANHLNQRIMADYAGDAPWDVVTGKILTSILSGFQSSLTQRVMGDRSVNPFLSVFSQEQSVEIVRIIAAQAAQTPGMLLGEGRNSELYNIAQAVAAFMADPNTSLASPNDWRLVIAVAVEEAAKNPGTLFSIDPNARPESHLAVSLVGMLLANAAAAVRDVPGIGETPRRRGSVLFGDTLRQAISMTLRAAANNASILLDEQRHLGALNGFIGKLQTYVQGQDGRLGAAEWLWLYRSFVAEVIATGTIENITDERLTAMVGALPGVAEPAPVRGDETEPQEEPTS